MMKLGRKIIQEELRMLDKLILDYRDKEIFVPKDFQPTTIKTKLGEIPIARRRYKMVINGETKWVYLLDELLEINDFGLYSQGIVETHPYASYERGCNENKNRLIRRYFKKGKLVEELSDEDILNIARKINNMPRKALGYKTPLEIFESNLKKRGIDTSFLDIYRIELPKCLVA